MLDIMRNIIDLEQLIISGGFNYSHLRPNELNVTTSQRWRGLLAQAFYNTMQSGDLQDFPTFQRRRGTDYIMSTIDYIYLGHNLRIGLCDTDIASLPGIWSDHSILSITLRLGTSSTGPGLWRGSPTYATHSRLRGKLEHRL